MHRIFRFPVDFQSILVVTFDKWWVRCIPRCQVHNSNTKKLYTLSILSTVQVNPIRNIRLRCKDSVDPRTWIPLSPLF